MSKMISQQVAYTPGGLEVLCIEKKERAAYSICLFRWWVLVVLGLGLLGAWSCTPVGGIWRTPTIPLYTSQPTLAGTLAHPPTIPERAPTTATLIPTPEDTPRPKWTASPSPTVVTMPPALSWTGPLIAPSRLPPSSNNAGVSIPIFDVGSGQSAQIPLPGFDRAYIRGWSTDGCFLIVTGYFSGGEAWYLVNVETGMSRYLDNTCGVKFSPDGKWMAYASCEEPCSSLYVVRADGSEPAKLVAECIEGLRGWTDDSRKVLYLLQEGKRFEDYGVYAVDVDSMERCLVSREPEPLERWEDLYLADPISCKRIPLALSISPEMVDRVDMRPAPGYRYLALFLGKGKWFGEFDTGFFQFLIVDLKTSEERIVIEEPFVMSNFWDWSPDGTRLVLVADLPDEGGVYLVEAATGRRRRLNIEPGTSPSWSPDGRWLSFQSLKGEPLHIPFIYNLETETITYLPSEFGYPFWAPDPLLWSPRLFYGSGACR